MITLNPVKSTPRAIGTFNNVNNAFRHTVVSYYNNSQHNLVVLDRDNIPTRLNGHDPAVALENTVTVQTKYQYANHNAFKENVQLLESLGERYKMISENHFILKKLFLQLKEAPYCTGAMTIMIENKISLENFIGNAHVYDPSTDVMLVDINHWGKFVHPSSPEYEEAVPVNKYIGDKKASGILVEIVDNSQRIAKRFFYCAGDVIPVSPHTDKARSDGVYLTKFINQSTGEIDTTGERYDLGQAESVVGLFKTEEDARTNGAPDTLIRQHETMLRKELMDKTHEIETVKRDALAQEARLKEEARERDAQLQREEYQRKRQAEEYAERQRSEDERRAREEARRKEEADERTHDLLMKKKKAEEDRLESDRIHQAEIHALKTRDLERDALFKAKEAELKEEAAEADRKAKKQEAKFKKKVAKAERKAKEKANQIERKAKEKANIADRKAKKHEAKIKKKAAKTALEAKRIAEDINRTSLITKEEYALRTQELAMQARRRDDYYEERSHQRKDSSELFKWVPTILTAGLAAFSIFKMI